MIKNTGETNYDDVIAKIKYDSELWSKPIF